MRVVEEVARAKGVDPLDLDPLFYRLDGDALDTLFERADTPLEVTFEYEEYTVTIDDTGEIDLED